jgi:hypothetical protein
MASGRRGAQQFSFWTDIRLVMAGTSPATMLTGQNETARTVKPTA